MIAFVIVDAKFAAGIGRGNGNTSLVRSRGGTKQRGPDELHGGRLASLIWTKDDEDEACLHLQNLYLRIHRNARYECQIFSLCNILLDSAK